MQLVGGKCLFLNLYDFFLAIKVSNSKLRETGVKYAHK